MEKHFCLSVVQSKLIKLANWSAVNAEHVSNYLCRFYFMTFLNSKRHVSSKKLVNLVAHWPLCSFYNVHSLGYFKTFFTVGNVQNASRQLGRTTGFLIECLRNIEEKRS